MTTTAKRTVTDQAVAKCRAGHFVRGTWDDAGRHGGWIYCPCGHRGIAKGLEVKVTEGKCGGRCQGSIGPVCDCSCGGENHGRARAFG